MNMKRMVDSIALLFNSGRRWLTGAPRYRGAVICGVSAIGAMIAIGYSANKGVSPPSAPVVQTSDVVPTDDSAKPNEGLPKPPERERRPIANGHGVG